ncbi:MAG: hypothetical protein IH795_02850 [Bacteroidetes bacterium]|nr:hypothetical protein [Bacteroidota bacterium]
MIKLKILSIILVTLIMSVLVFQNNNIGNTLETDSIYDIPEVTDFSSLQKAFQQGNGSVRLVALLSPSCSYCIKGYRYMIKLLEEIVDERLKMYIIWEPMLSGDSKELADKVSKEVNDPRMVFQAWDENLVNGKLWTSVMKKADNRWLANGPAWDVYFLYRANEKWDEDKPTKPGYWQHQGAGTAELMLNYSKLKSKIEEFLAELN